MMQKAFLIFFIFSFSLGVQGSPISVGGIVFDPSIPFDFTIRAQNGGYNGRVVRIQGLKKSDYSESGKWLNWKFNDRGDFVLRTDGQVWAKFRLINSEWTIVGGLAAYHFTTLSILDYSNLAATPWRGTGSALVIPEPGSIALVFGGLAMALLFFWGRRKIRREAWPQRTRNAPSIV